MASVPGFLTKTFEIFSSSEYSDCCGWGSNGETIIIRKIEQFSKNILPKYFKHSNFQSFVRQLNMYDFHKTVQDPNHGEFTHQYFSQHKPELLVYIKRKANKPPESSIIMHNKKHSKGLSNQVIGSLNSSSSILTTNNINNGQNHNNIAAMTNCGGLLANVMNSNSRKQNIPPLTSNNVINKYNQYTTNIRSGDNVLMKRKELSYVTEPVSDLEMSHQITGTAAYNYYDNHNNYTNHNNLCIKDEDGVVSGSGGGSLGAYFNYNSEDDPTVSQNASVYHNSHRIITGEIVQESDSVLSDIQTLNMNRENFERRMEAKLAKLECENAMLQQQFRQSQVKNNMMQERMERVLKAIYNIYVAGQTPTNNIALTNLKSPQLLTDLQFFQNQQLIPILTTASVRGGGEVDPHTQQQLLQQQQLSSTIGNNQITNNATISSSSYMTTAAGMMPRLDSISLTRLPSIDLDELQNISASYLLISPPAPSSSELLLDNHHNCTAADMNNYWNNNSSNNSDNAATILNSATGMELLSHSNRGNSFDFAASSVAGVPLQHQSSFDTYAINLLNNASNNNNNFSNFQTEHSNPFSIINPIEQQQQCLGPITNTVVSAIISINNEESTTSGLLGLGLPLTRQKTFDHIASLVNSSDNDSGGVYHNKRMIDDLYTDHHHPHSINNKHTNIASPISKQPKLATHRMSSPEIIAKEMTALANEDIYSSLSEAQQFFQNHKINEENTLIRLDSLESTIASFFVDDVSDTII